MKRQWSDIVSETTVDIIVREKTVTLKTTGHEKSRVSVCLAAKADGTKLKPMLVLKGPNVKLPFFARNLNIKAKHILPACLMRG